MMRKLFIYILFAVAMPAAAQSDMKAAGAAIDSVIRIFPNFEIVDKFVADIFKKNEKSAPLAARIGKAYYNYVLKPGAKQPTYHRRDVTKALEYFDKAVTIDPKYAQTYLYLSDMYYWEAKIDTALIWLDKGIAANPTDSALYIESAKLLAFSDPDAAVQKLMVLKERDSTFQVDLQLGRLYWILYQKHGKTPMVEMATAYGKVFDSKDRDKMTLGDFGAYAEALRWATDMGNERLDRLYEGMNYALKFHHEDYVLEHYLLYGCTQSRRWDDGIAAAKAIFRKPDSIQAFKIDDHMYYATCLAGNKQYAEAVAEYERILNMGEASDNQKTMAENFIDQTFNTQVKELTAMGEYEQAAALIEPYVVRSREKGKQNDQLANSFAQIYFEWSNELNGQEKLDVIAKGIKVCEESARYSELNAPMFLYYCCQYSWSYLDSDFKKSLALPYAEQIISLLESKSDLSRNERLFLILGYRYMAAYEYLNKYAIQKIKTAKKTALAYAEKILDIDGTNEWALNFLTQVH